MKRKDLYEPGKRYNVGEIGWIEIVSETRKTEEGDLVFSYRRDGSDKIYTGFVDVIGRSIEAITSKTDTHFNPANFSAPFQKVEVNERYAFVLGYLSGHGTILADVPSNRIPNFRREYTSLKGQEPEKEKEGYRPYASGGKTWEYALRMALKLNEHVLREDFFFTSSIEAPKNTEGESLLISDNVWIWNLLRIGFCLGAKHAKEKIRNSLPKELQNNFDEGCKV